MAVALLGRRGVNCANPSPADRPWVGSSGLPDAREQLLSWQSSLEKQQTTGFRDVHDLSAGTAKEDKGVREAYEEEAPQYLAEELYWEALNWADDNAKERNFEPVNQLEEAQEYSGEAPGSGR